MGSVDILVETDAVAPESIDLPYKGYVCEQCSVDLDTQDAVAIPERQSDVYKKFDAPQTPMPVAPPADPLQGLQWDSKIKGYCYKRLFDIVGACALIIATSPLLLVAFIAIRLQDGGASIFAQDRVGLHGHVFKCFKFRSMVADAEHRLNAYLDANPEARHEWEASRKLKDDPRITRLGNFLRRSSIDELPQLFNVLRGEMSLVGPRPVVPDEIARYGMQAIHYLRVRPGLTGLWQVSGRSDTSYETRVLLDREYALNRTFWSDIMIVIRTIPAVLKSHGAV